MSYWHNYKPIELAFYYWTAKYPDSFHPCDNARFYEFVGTLHIYKRQGRRWLNQEYFTKRCIASGFVNENHILLFYEKMKTILAFLDSRKEYVRTHMHHRDDDYFSYYALAVINGRIVQKRIDEETYRKRKVNKRTFE